MKWMIFDFSQASMSISIPKEHHRFILGKNGTKLKELEKTTATKITVPNVADSSDKITITGTKEGIEKAVHEIKVTSDEQVFVIIFWKIEIIHYRRVFTNWESKKDQRCMGNVTLKHVCITIVTVGEQ